jgi:CheY-like chemotaxis protein
MSLNMQTLLLVEDSPDDQFIMKRALTAAGVANPLQIVEDGEEAVHYLDGAGKFGDREKYPLPALVFLDLKLPFRSGIDVLKWLRGEPRFDGIVVVVLTSSDHPSDIKTAYSSGANSYLVKPPTAGDLVDMAKSFRWYWLEYNRFESASAR